MRKSPKTDTTCSRNMSLSVPLYKLNAKLSTESYNKSIEERHAKKAKAVADMQTMHTKYLTDAQILECRQLRNEGFTASALVEMFQVPPAFMYRVLAYEVRAKLIPKRK